MGNSEDDFSSYVEKGIKLWSEFKAAGVLDFECSRNLAKDLHLHESTIEDEIRRIIILGRELTTCFTKDLVVLDLRREKCDERPLLPAFYFWGSSRKFLELYKLICLESLIKVVAVSNSLVDWIASDFPSDSEFNDWLDDWSYSGWPGDQVEGWIEILESLFFDSEKLLEIAQEREGYQDSYGEKIAIWYSSKSRYEYLAAILFGIFRENADLLQPMSKAFDLTTSVKELEELSTHEVWAVRHTVAINPKTPWNLLEELAKDPELEIYQITQARNHNIPMDILSKLALHEDISIRSAVFKNPKATQEIKAATALLGTQH